MGLIAQSKKKGYQAQYEEDKLYDFKQGLFFQRELFKSGKDGTGNNNYDQMCDSLENLKSDLKGILIKKQKGKTIKKVEEIIRWYRTKELRFTKNTEEGSQVVFPADMVIRVNKNLTIGYELLVQAMYEEGLL